MLRRLAGRAGEARGASFAPERVGEPSRVGDIALVTRDLGGDCGVWLTLAACLDGEVGVAGRGNATSDVAGFVYTFEIS